MGVLTIGAFAQLQNSSKAQDESELRRIESDSGKFEQQNDSKWMDLLADDWILLGGTKVLAKSELHGAEDGHSAVLQLARRISAESWRIPKMPYADFGLQQMIRGTDSRLDRRERGFVIAADPVRCLGFYTRFSYFELFPTPAACAY